MTPGSTFDASDVERCVAQLQQQQQQQQGKLMQQQQQGDRHQLMAAAAAVAALQQQQQQQQDFFVGTRSRRDSERFVYIETEKKNAKTIFQSNTFRAELDYVTQLFKANAQFYSLKYGLVEMTPPPPSSK